MFAAEPPIGQSRNLVNPPSLQKWLVLTVAVCLSFAMLFIALRMFVKSYVVKKVEIEDYALIFSGAAFAAFRGVLIAAGSAGQSKHFWDLTLAQAGHVNYLANIAIIIYGPVIFPAKLCVLLQMQRLFRGSKRDSIFWCIQVLIWSNFLLYLAVSLALVDESTPRAKISHAKIPGHCINPIAVLLAVSAINIVSDVSILLLPVFTVWKLQLALKRKLTISAAFGFGVFACMSSIIRLIYTIHLSRSKDIIGFLEATGMWVCAQFTTVILAAAIPTLPRLIQYLRRAKSPTTSSRRRFDYYYAQRPSSGHQYQQKPLKLAYLAHNGGGAELGADAGGGEGARRHVPLGPLSPLDGRSGYQVEVGAGEMPRAARRN